MSIIIKNHKVSSYRINTMINAHNEKQAIKLRRWHGFLQAIGFYTTGVKLREDTLRELYNELHDDKTITPNNLTKSTDTTNIDRLITFIKIRELINTQPNSQPAQLQFKVCLEKSSIGTLTHINFKIGDTSICKKKADPVLDKVISNFTDRYKVLLPNITPEMVQNGLEDFQAAADKAATTFQNIVRRKQSMKKQLNDKGFYEVKDTDGELRGYVKFRTQRNNNKERVTEVILGKPKQLTGELNPYFKGNYKQMVAQDHEVIRKQVVLDEKKATFIYDESAPTYVDSGYVGLIGKSASKKPIPERILVALRNLKYIVPQYNVKGDFWVAKNLNFTINYLMQNRVSVPLYKFKNLLSNIKDLHKLNIVHQDIKPENLFFHREEVYLSDLDSMEKMGNLLPGFGTPEQCPDKLLYNPNRYGKLIDNLCMLKSLIMVKQRSYKLTHNQITAWIEANVKEEFQQQCELLLNKPTEYYKRYMQDGEPVALYDMINWR